VRYLKTAWWPDWRTQLGASRLLPGGRTRAWPLCSQLQQLPGHRRLERVTRITPKSLAQATVTCEPCIIQVTGTCFEHFSGDLDLLQSIMIEATGPDTPCVLRLPSSELVELDDEDLVILSQELENQDHFSTLIQTFVMNTVSEAVRLLEDFTVHDPEIEQLRFHVACVFQGASWDIIALVRFSSSNLTF
jgi:hypothetical protein